MSVFNYKFFLFISIFSIASCGTSITKASLGGLSANDLCAQFVISRYNASSYNSKDISNELTRREISIADCNKSEFDIYVYENLPKSLPLNFNRNSNSDEVEELKKQIKSIKQKADSLQTKDLLNDMYKNLENKK
jgi:hypothetical protein